MIKATTPSGVLRAVTPLAALALVLFTPSVLNRRATASAPTAVGLILDTDIGPDCDDVGAVALLHGLAERGEVRLLAMAACTSSEWAAPCLDALNTYYGRPGIPVGTLKEGGFLTESAYNRAVALRYPHRLRSGRDAPDATTLYRQTLAAQPDKSVAIVAVGPLRNLRNLLESGPDRFSPLDGRSLVEKKVAVLSCMGGWYPAVPDGSGAEWNFAQDAGAAREVTDDWPTPVLFSGAEIGSGIMTGRRFATDTAEYNPATLAYALSPDVGFGGDRASWDQTAALAAVRGVRDYWKASEGGRNRMDDKGANAFTPLPGGRHRYLIKSLAIPAVEDAIESLMVSPREGPLTLDWNIATYARSGMGTVTTLPVGPGIHAFDGDSRTAWEAAKAGSWVQYQCPDGKRYPVSRYRLSVMPDGSESYPVGWTLSGSQDGRTWARLDTRSEVSFVGSETREFTCANDTAYNFYRFRLDSDRTVRIAELELRERVDRRRGVRVNGLRLDRSEIRLPVSGRKPLNVAVLPQTARDGDVAWASSDIRIAIVRRIGKNTAIVAGRNEGMCTVIATSRDGNKRAVCRVRVTPPTLPVPWRFDEINAPAVPGEAAFVDGVFTVTGGGMAIERWWLRIWDQFVLVSQPADGDAELSARLTAQSEVNPHAIAGVMFRETLARDSRFVLLGRYPTGEVFLTWRNRPDDEGPRTVIGKFPLPCRLKLERRGATFTASLSQDGKAWKTIGSHTGQGYTGAMRVGLCVTAHNIAATGTARFDDARFRAGEEKSP